jgi:diguanylate cyclase with GGDEF domain
MTTVPQEPGLHAVEAADGLRAMLPPRAAVLDRLAELRPGSAERPVSLLIVGLRRRDDGWPIPPAALDEVTMRLARGLREDDWLGRCGPTEFVVLVAGPAAAAEGAAARLVESIDTEQIRHMTAAAGVAALAPELSADEVLRRAMVSLTTARSLGAGQVVAYSGTR